MSFIGGIFRSIADRFHHFRQWWLHRRSVIQSLEIQRDSERIRHAAEIEVKDSAIKLRDEQIAFLTLMHKDNCALIEEKLATHARKIADAQSNPRFIEGA